VCFSVLIIRFGIWNQADTVKRSVGAIELFGIIAIFIFTRIGIGFSGADGFLFGAARWLGLSGVDAIKNYAELILFSVIAGYLFRRLARDVMCKEIEETVKRNRLRWYSDQISKVIGDKDFDRTRQILEAKPLWAEKGGGSKTIEWVEVVFTATGVVVTIIDLVMKYVFTGH
jgi:hypothetical protein